MLILIHTDNVEWVGPFETTIGIYSSEEKVKEAIERNMAKYSRRVEEDYSFQKIVVDEDIED